MEAFSHITVLKHQTVDATIPESKVCLDELCSEKPFVFVDCTLGGGGHSIYFIEQFSKKFPEKEFIVVGIDRDREALAVAEQRVQQILPSQGTFFPWHTSFNSIKNIKEVLKNIDNIHALIADLGVSSPQLDRDYRGFSLRNDGPLDMRMNQDDSICAKDILQTYSREELQRIFFTWGEEPRSKKLAQRITSDRDNNQLPLDSTTKFAEYVKKVLAYPPNSRTHPATRVFQALRIEVNKELECVNELLDAIPNLMSSVGKTAFITFHSLEDRLVKQAMRKWEKPAPHVLTPFPTKNEETLGTEFPRGGIKADENECKNNPRSRSARLRVFHFGRSRKSKKNKYR